MGDWLAAHGIEILVVILLFEIRACLKSLIEKRSALDLDLFGGDHGLSLGDINQVRIKFGLEKIDWSKTE